VTRPPIIALLSLALLSPALAQPPGTGGGGPQARIASKTARFTSVKRTEKRFKDSLEAANLAAATSRKGKTASFHGKVARVFSPQSGRVVILNFHEDYKKAVVAVVQKENFPAFPDLKPLEGKEVLISGEVTLYQERPQVVLRKPDQVWLVE